MAVAEEPAQTAVVWPVGEDQPTWWTVERRVWMEAEPALGRVVLSSADSSSRLAKLVPTNGQVKASCEACESEFSVYIIIVSPQRP